ncbi:hypothetical protein AQUCO_00300701v1 [Aquilegia coerulea]|uniref:Uncharacterized protein n=1 Tax=Aquilegia coerulea TaxID=218851 RepID=A0A2G5F028_AQUCA|nr:hypothetical protein AQUCO_00300701v1 [Aquilegia coerulea]
MARSFSNVKLIASLVENVSLAINRRGFSAVATQGGGAAVRATGSTSSRMVKQTDVERTMVKEESWVPDPVTGYYRPENRGDEVDVAELREMLLNNKKN